jgi:hypothetical protein
MPGRMAGFIWEYPTESAFLKNKKRNYFLLYRIPGGNARARAKKFPTAGWQ